MAEEAQDQDGDAEGAAPPPAPPINLLKFLPVVLLVLLIQFGGAWYYIEYRLFETAGSSTLMEMGEDLRPRTRPEGDEPAASVDLGEFVVNPRGTEARLLLSVDVTLTVGPKGAQREIESEFLKDRVRDAVIWELSNATHDQLRDLEGRSKVKERIRDRINDFLYDGQVMEVWFGKFILQAMSGYTGGR